MYVKIVLTILSGSVFLVSGFDFLYASVQTGYRGVKSSWGKVDSNLIDTGFSWVLSMPFATRVDIVETRPQKDYLTKVECGTNDGLKLLFETVEIGNQLPPDHVISTISRFGTKYDEHLVKDLVRHQLNVICSKKSAHQIAIEEFEQLDDLMKEFIQSENDRQESGVLISFVRFSKPVMPKEIEANYLALAEERTMKKVVMERQARFEAEKESEMIIAQKNNAINIQTADNQNEIIIMGARAEQAKQIINNEIIISTANANAERVMKEAEALSKMYAIPGYTDVLKTGSLSNNQKIYYGDKIPQYIGYPQSSNS